MLTSLLFAKIRTWLTIFIDLELSLRGIKHYFQQEIAEQREAMDKMMKLWKDLMRCFKGISQTQDKDKILNVSPCDNRMPVRIYTRTDKTRSDWMKNLL